MRKLGGGHGFSKIDLADVYNQVKLDRGVLLQNVLPFEISSAPCYFQKVMDDISKDLKAVAVYLDNILVSGSNEEDHLHSLRCLLERRPRIWPRISGLEYA